MRPARGKVLVKRVETEETLPGGHIIFTDRAREEWAQWQVEVIAVGKPAFCTRYEKRGRVCDKHIHEMELDLRVFGGFVVHSIDDRLQPGAWCIIRHRSLVPVGNEDKRFLCNQEDILGVFQDG